jgi:hypothetical protein
MLRVLRRFGRRLRIGSLERGDFSDASERPVENLDAGMAASQHQHTAGTSLGTSYPPGYVKSYDEGRPRT